MRGALAWGMVLICLAGCFPTGQDSGPQLRQALQVPYYRGELKPELVKVWQQRDLVFEQLRFRGRDHEWVDALVCYSELGRFRPLPALLCIPGSGNYKEQLVQPMDLMPRWADQGFFVVSVDRNGDDLSLLERKGLAGMWGHQVHNLVRTIDYMQGRPEVAPDRIGMLGLSMGGMEALWLAALDARVKVVVSAAGHLTWGEVFGGDSWRMIFADLPLGRHLLQADASGAEAWQAFCRAYPQLPELDAGRSAAQLAPRPLLLMTGGRDPYTPPAATARVYDEARPAFALSGKVGCLEMWVEPEAGHGFSYAMQDRALAWFQRWL